MIAIKEQYTVARNIGEVFDFVSNPVRDPEWQEIVQEVRMLGPLPTRQGTPYTITFGFMGRRMHFEVEVARHAAPREYRYRSTSGPFAFDGGYELAAPQLPGDPTRVTLELNIDPRGYFGIVPEALLVQVFKKQLRRSIARQRQLLEQVEEAVQR